jgi:hypothetical protein
MSARRDGLIADGFGETSGPRGHITVSPAAVSSAGVGTETTVSQAAVASAGVGTETTVSEAAVASIACVGTRKEEHCKV